MSHCRERAHELMVSLFGTDRDQALRILERALRDAEARGKMEARCRAPFPEKTQKPESTVPDGYSFAD